MRSALAAALQWLVLPWGATSGARIVLNSETGSIEIYNSADELVISISATGQAIQVWQHSFGETRLAAEFGMVTGVDGGMVAYNGSGSSNYEYVKIAGSEIALGFVNATDPFASDARIYAANSGSSGTPADPQYLVVNSGEVGDTDHQSSTIRLYSGTEGSLTDMPTVYVESGINTRGPADLVVRGRATSGGERVGRATISVTTANTPVSATVTYPTMITSTLEAFATANSANPLTAAASVTTITTTSATVWLNRTTVGSTVVHWQVKART